MPWHDRGWDGHVCDAPLANSSCLALKFVAENRKDEIEDGIAGMRFEDLTPDQMPPCLQMSSSFLSSGSYMFQSIMAYSKWSKDHSHISPLTISVPSWGSLTIPYRWMLKESGFEIASDLGLDACMDREPSSPDWLGRTSWIQGFDNQKSLLEAFAAPLVEDESLVIFYATRTPLCDDERRVILGAAILKKKHKLKEYPYSGKGLLRAMAWERPIQHSLRPAPGGDGMTGGIVMPYHALLDELERRPDLNPADFVAFAPDDTRAQFSYGSEHVSHGAAAAALLSARASLERTAEVLNGPWERYIEWIDDRLSRLWKLQGPAPGLGVVLSALHDGFNGTLFAIALADELDENADPWPVVDDIFSDGRLPPNGAPHVTGMLKRRWKSGARNPEWLAVLKLMARLELTKDQAARALKFDSIRILDNPYLLFEEDRTAFDPVSFGTVDRGLYPGNGGVAHPLPDGCNSELAEYDNACRLRAACVQILETAANNGHTLLPVNEVTVAAAELPSVHKIPLNAEIIDICRDDFTPVVEVVGKNEEIIVQLHRYVRSGELLRVAVEERLSNPPKSPKQNWRELVDRKFGIFDPNDAEEERARVEKAAALECLAKNRIGVLVGPAGTGKTSVLELLLAKEEIVGTRVRLLAPTGKARVRLSQETGREDNVQTVAQFLLGLDRFDTATGRYYVNSDAPRTEATTCIVDESSMLTEDMLAALVDALPRNCRLILAGDPYQLPPIGAGCPFVDILENLKRRNGEPGVAELKTLRRQSEISGGQNSPLTRADVQLAAVFSGRPLPPGEDEIVARAIEGKDDDTVRYREWKNTGELADLIESVLTEELECSKADLTDELELSFGAARNKKGYLEFERGCADAVDNWQVLSVNRNAPGGSIFLNRMIKERLRGERLRKSVESNRVPHYRDWMRFIKPRGAEQIVYGDKVICVRNHRRTPWLYKLGTEGDKEFVANGEIGLITGQTRWGKSNPKFTHVEFSGRKDRNFSFRRSDFSEDGMPYLELAYAITIHKAQGSEFESVILVLPAESRLVSREMLYTALTRQKRRIWILHQGPFDRFLSLRQYVFSDIAARFTNLLRTSAPKSMRMPTDIPAGLGGPNRGFLEERLIHRTMRGEMVSSKNELVIANILHGLERAGYLTYHVEPRLPFDDGRGRWADFLIESKGENWYWEHCGMMHNEDYRLRWERKKELYERNGFGVYGEQNPDGRLIVTEDGPEQGLDSQKIEKLVRRLFV